VTISEELKGRIREAAGDRCGYCLSSQKYILGPLEIDHIIPQAAGGSDEEENLWLACRMCNNYKKAQTHTKDPITGQIIRLFNPREQEWTEHFMWNAKGTHIIGLTACGRSTVVALQLNNLIAITVREQWVAAGWHPPEL